MNTGSCHCGEIEFEVPKELGDVRLCYCETCRKLSGSAFSAVAFVKSSEFKILKGQSKLVHYESSKGKFRYYCSKCHSPICVKLESKPETLRIRLGVLNFDPDVNISAHIWVKEKPKWYVITDDLPKHEMF